MKALKKMMSILVITSSLVACGWSGETQFQQSKQYASGEVTKGGERKGDSVATTYSIEYLATGSAMKKTWGDENESDAFGMTTCHQNGAIPSSWDFSEEDGGEFSQSGVTCRKFTSRGTLSKRDRDEERLFDFKGYETWNAYTSVSAGHLPVGLKIRHKRGKLIDVRFTEQIVSQLNHEKIPTSPAFGYVDGEVTSLKCTGNTIIGRIKVGYQMKRGTSSSGETVAHINFVKIYCVKVTVE